MRVIIFLALMAGFALFGSVQSAAVDSVNSDPSAGNVNIENAAEEAAAAALLDVDAGAEQNNESPREARQFFGGYYGRPYYGGYYGRPYYGGYYGRPYYGGYYGGYRRGYPGFGFYG